MSENSSPTGEDSPVLIDSVSFQDIRDRLNDRMFILSVVMSEMDVLGFKSGTYKTMATKTQKKRTDLAEYHAMWCQCEKLC
jgi:hypothetical protein